jgi:hypothetical protein
MKIIPNPDTDKYAEATVAVYNNGGFCPCLWEKTDNTKCPCKEFREQKTEGLCNCGRFMKVRNE